MNTHNCDGSCADDFAPEHASGPRAFFGLIQAPWAVLLLATAPALCAPPPGAEPGQAFRAGAAMVEVNPPVLPVHVLGMFTDRVSDEIHDTLAARCLVLDDGRERLAIVVVDSCMMPRDLLDQAKEFARARTGIATDHMLISATHTHSAPAAMGGLGTPADTNYARFLPGRIAEGIFQAAQNLVPARIGWATVRDAEHTHCRRWIRRPDRLGTDPFGGQTVRANMHPGHMSPDAIGPAGPVDPELSVLAVQSRQGQPLALLANYSMHYYGSPTLSADYFGHFARHMGGLVGATNSDPPFVAMMSQGTSGDLMWMNYGQPARDIGVENYARELAAKAFEAYQKITYRDWVPLAMREAALTLRFRLPDQARRAWAQPLLSVMQGRLPQTLPEVYACETVYLQQRPEAELKLQAVRVGDLGITAIPNEVYGVTGLKIKTQSPLPTTFNIELANGSEGYIPPPEQHALGGYTTWPARTAGLETNAEPRIVETLLDLLEQVAGRPRQPLTDTHGTYAQAVLTGKPLAYWRLSELSGPQARDATGQHPALYEAGIAFHLDGPASPAFSGEGAVNRAAHFAGGRLQARLSGLDNNYSVAFWFWNGLPNDKRPVTGYLFSRGPDLANGAPGDHLGIGGTHENGAHQGRLFFFNGNQLNQVVAGDTLLEPKTWHHVTLVRFGKTVTLYLDGKRQPETSGQTEPGYPAGADQVFLGGRNDNFANFEGKLDEISVYNRALTADEVVASYQAARPPVQEAAARSAGASGPTWNGQVMRATPTPL